LSITTIGLTLLFFVPGYLIYSLVALPTPRRSEVEKLLFLRFLTFSTLNFVINIALIAAFKHDVAHRRPLFTLCHTVMAAWYLFLSPFFVGTIISWLDQQEIAREIFSRIGINTMTGPPTAWDSQFQRLYGNPAYMIVTMTNGNKFFGYYGDASCASSDPSERDLYLQKQYSIQADGTWVAFDRESALLLKGSEISVIEIIWE